MFLIRITYYWAVWALHNFSNLRLKLYITYHTLILTLYLLFIAITVDDSTSQRFKAMTWYYLMLNLWTNLNYSFVWFSTDVKYYWFFQKFKISHIMPVSSFSILLYLSTQFGNRWIRSTFTSGKFFWYIILNISSYPLFNFLSLGTSILHVLYILWLF